MGRKDNGNHAVFVDRDGTIIREKNYLRKIKDVKLIRGAVSGLKMLARRGYKLFIVTNQSGIARGYLSEKKLKQINGYLVKLLNKKGAAVDGVYFCPHMPGYGCKCRKPALGMVVEACRKTKINLSKSFAVGDHVNDFLLGQNMGGRGIFLLTGHGRKELKKIKASCGGLKPDFISKNLFEAAKIIIKNGGIS